MGPQRMEETTRAGADVDDQTVAGGVPFDLTDDEFVFALEPPVVGLDERHRRVRIGCHGGRRFGVDATDRTTDRNRGPRHVDTVAQRPHAAALTMVPTHCHRRRADTFMARPRE